MSLAVFSCPPVVSFLLCFQSCYSRRFSVCDVIYLTGHNSAAKARYLIIWLDQGALVEGLMYVFYWCNVRIIVSNQQLTNWWHTVPIFLILFWLENKSHWSSSQGFLFCTFPWLLPICHRIPPQDVSSPVTHGLNLQWLIVSSEKFISMVTKSEW